MFTFPLPLSTPYFRSPRFIMSPIWILLWDQERGKRGFVVVVVVVNVVDVVVVVAVADGFG